MKRVLVVYIGLSVLPACGSLDANPSSPPALATLQGSLLNPTSIDVSSSAAIRVAVVWKSIAPGQFNVAEDLPVQPVFPSAFRIELDHPPPETAMNSVASITPPSPPMASGGFGSAGSSSGSGSSAPEPSPGGGPPDGAGATSVDASPAAPASNGASDFRFAFGAVVAYLDINHNGKLDLVPEGATAYVDQILAANQYMSIAYFEGPIPAMLGEGSLADSTGHLPADGYNLFLDRPCPPRTILTAPHASNPSCMAPPAQDAGPCGQSQWLGMDSPYPLTVDSSPMVASLMCSASDMSSLGSASGGAPLDPTIQPAQYPSPCDPNVMCATDGSDYYYYTCTTVSRGLCLGTIETCTTVGYTRPTPPPPDWPCVAQ